MCYSHGCTCFRKRNQLNVESLIEVVQQLFDLRMQGSLYSFMVSKLRRGDASLGSKHFLFPFGIPHNHFSSIVFIDISLHALDAEDNHTSDAVDIHPLVSPIPTTSMSPVPVTGNPFANSFFWPCTFSFVPSGADDVSHESFVATLGLCSSIMSTFFKHCLREHFTFLHNPHKNTCHWHVPQCCWLGQHGCKESCNIYLKHFSFGHCGLHYGSLATQQHIKFHGQLLSRTKWTICKFVTIICSTFHIVPIFSFNSVTDNPAACVNLHGPHYFIVDMSNLLNLVDFSGSCSVVFIFCRSLCTAKLWASPSMWT